MPACKQVFPTGMFFKFFVFSLVSMTAIWYFHEYHTSQFMAITRNIPYLNEMMVKLHSSLKTSSGPTDKKSSKELLFTENELKDYDGGPGSKGTYIAILGKVYDVKKGKKHYGPGGTYHIFAGRDSSRAFVTGDFTETGASDDVLDLSNSEILSLLSWQSFYAKDYKYVGKLIGKYFTASGDKTDYHLKLDKKVREARSSERSKAEDKMNFPPCNMEWDAKSGSRVWCTNKSGGVDRDWIGVPRKLYEVGAEGSHCVCINLNALSDLDSPQYKRRKQLEEYDGCEYDRAECFIP